MMTLYLFIMTQASLLSPPVPLGPSTLPRRIGWPRRWAEQMPLLERQHERLEQLLGELIQWHGAGALSPGPSAEQFLDQGCQRLLRLLGLHLRLEERFLMQWGCLCAGHRANHLQAAREFAAGVHRSGSDRAARLALLLTVKEWFRQHLRGSDALAYASASQVRLAAEVPLPTEVC